MRKILCFNIVCFIVGCSTPNNDLSKDHQDQQHIFDDEIRVNHKNQVDRLREIRLLGFNSVKLLAEKGDINAMCVLGDFYRVGDYTKKDERMAEKWYRQAANNGSADAMLGLGLIERRKNGGGNSARLYSMALTNGCVDAMYFLGLSTRNKQERVSLWNKAIEKGSTFTMAKVGYVYLMERKVDEGRQMLLDAAEKGDIFAMTGLASAYELGFRLEKNEIEAAKWYARAAEMGDGFAMCKIGECCKTGKGVPQNHAVAIKWFHKAAKLGYVKALYQLGACYNEGIGTDKDEEEAVKLWNVAASNGNNDAKKALVESQIVTLVSQCKWCDIVGICDKELMDVNGVKEWREKWIRYKKKAETGLREIELARISERRNALEGLLAEKRYDDVIAECEKERGNNLGSRPEDANIWRRLKDCAQAEKDKIDRSLELKRIAKKRKYLEQLLAKNEFDKVIALCDEEKGQGRGAKSEDLKLWKSIRINAKANDLLSKSNMRSETTFCLKGFYLGMSMEEAEILLDYYLPGISYSRKGNAIVIANQAMHFCEAKLGKVTRLNFSRMMLEKWFDYDVQSDSEWFQKFAAEYNLEFRSGYIKDRKEKGDASISVSQECYTHRNSRKNFIMKYFGEKDVSDYNKDPEEIKKDAMARAMSFGNDMAYRDVAYQIGHRAGYLAECVKQVRSWAKEEYDNGKGGAEGTLRIEIMGE